MTTKADLALNGLAGKGADADLPREKFPKRSVLMDDAEAAALAFMSFPKPHCTQIHSTNSLERLNAEIKRRTEVVGIFPNEAAVTPLAGALLLEQNDELQLQRRYMQLEGLQLLADNQPARLAAVISSARVQSNQKSRLVHHSAGHDRLIVWTGYSRACSLMNS